MKTVYLAIEVLTHQVFKDGELVSSTKEVKHLGVRSPIESSFMLCNYRLEELEESLKDSDASVNKTYFSELAQLAGTGNFKTGGQTFSVGEATLSGVSPFNGSLTYKDSCELLIEVTNYKEIKPHKLCE